MKKLMLGLTVAAFAATPALAHGYRQSRTPATTGPLAQSYAYDPGSAGIYDSWGDNGSPGYGTYESSSGVRAYAYAPDNGAYATYGGPYASADAPRAGPPGVYQYGVYQGWDPDPSIRLSLMRVPNGQNVQ